MTSLYKWAVSIVLTTVIALAAAAVHSVYSDVDKIKVNDARQDLEIAVDDERQAEIIRRLNDIDAAVGNLNVPRYIHSGSSSTARKPTKQEILNGD
jgi:anionic cell wall polymer biosynthesis LytR-Cps2A-Psr (LCP) family protein